MRVGQNPAKSIAQVPQPARLTVAVVNYIPFLSGYYAQSLEVLKTCLNSIWQNTPGPFDLLLFDNASCQEVQNYLIVAHQQGCIQYLVLSEKNMGKGGAWNFIFQAAPGEIIAYSDSDVYFHSGWLERSLELLESFPQVGMVTARPLRTSEEFFTSTLTWAHSQPEARLEQGKFMPWDDFKEHTDSLGMSPEEAENRFQSMTDWKIEYRGQVAYLGAAHFQFLGWKHILQSQTPFPIDRPMGQVRSLDIRLNEAGYLRLMTSQPLVKHLGNRLGGPPAVNMPSRGTKARPRMSLLRMPLVRRSMMWVYDAIFRLYYE